MPYESRLKRYQQEKDELFLMIGNMTATEVERKHKELVQKWRV